MMANHLDYLEQMGTTASEWEATVSTVAQELVDILRENGCTYYDAKAALSKADSILERTMLKAKI